MLETDTPKLSCKKEEKVSRSDPINKGPGNVRSGYAAASSSLEVTGHVNKRAFACFFSLLSQDDNEGTNVSLRYGQHFMPACKESAFARDEQQSYSTVSEVNVGEVFLTSG